MHAAEPPEIQAILAQGLNSPLATAENAAKFQEALAVMPDKEVEEKLSALQ